MLITVCTGANKVEAVPARLQEERGGQFDTASGELTVKIGGNCKSNCTFYSKAKGMPRLSYLYIKILIINK